MGNCCPIVRFRRRPSVINPKNVTLLLVGLDNSGKTTIAKRLSEEPLDGVLPTVGFSKVTLQEKGCTITIYDLGGGPQIRDIWSRYYADVHGVIFVIDASDAARMNECRRALEGVLLDRYISGKPVLLLANKQDIDGALDEIDIVDRLNVERLVNQQKCPTLVELCSARHFSRKMDVGIDNGYKWLLRCISKDYPSLNNRVLKDLATQEELERIHRVQLMERIRRRQEQEQELGDIQERKESTNSRLVQVPKDVKAHQNGIVKMVDEVRIPGQVHMESTSSKIEENAIKMAHLRNAFSSSSEIFNYENENSDIQLIQNIEDNSRRKNFLLRPKSSGARLNTIRSESTKRRATRRKSYHRNNKTAPNPMAEISLEPLGSLPRIFQSEHQTEVKPFSEPSENEENCPPKDESVLEGDASPGILLNSSTKMRLFMSANDKPMSKSMPNSRKASAKSASQKYPSSDQVSNLSKIGNLPPLKLPVRGSAGKEFILDVTTLNDQM